MSQNRLLAHSKKVKTGQLFILLSKKRTLSYLIGRGKIKKIIKGPLGLAIIAKIVAFLPLLLIGVKFLAIKALVTAKIAFILAAMLIMNKMFGGAASGTSPLNLLSKVAGGIGGGASVGTTAAGWSNAGAPSAQYPYARSYEDAQELAYSAQVPQQ